jgi:carboxymethylenebutenolidase
MEIMRFQYSFRIPTRLLAMLLILGTAVTIHAQGLFSFLNTGSTEAFCSGGHGITVERFSPMMPGTYPAVIVLHGADGMEEGADSYRMVAQLLADNGYVGLIVHYYDRTGKPANPEKAAEEPKNFKAWVAVVHDAVKYARSLPDVDRDRIGIVGFSLGGYLATATASENSRVKAVIEVSGGIPDQYIETMKSMPPTLIIHGENDETVPVAHAYKLRDAIKAKGGTYKIKVYPCEGHLFEDEAMQDGLQLGTKFLCRYL